MSRSFLRGAVAGLVCAVLGGGTVALAGSGVGGVFNLGVSNSVDAKTTLTGASPGIQLQVTNTSAAAGTSGLAVNSSSTATTGVFTNTGGGPAGGFFVNAGVRPFTVSSSAKVPNLNADQLDGRDSAYFLPKTAKAADSNLLDGIDSTGFLRNLVPLSLSGSDPTAAVSGTNTGPGNGVQGTTSASAASGVYGQNDGGGIGIAGRSNQSGGVGVYGEATGPGGLAGSFQGDVSITGALKVGGAQVVTGGKLLRNAVALGPNNCCNFTVLEDPGYWRIGYLCPDPLTNLGVITIGNKSSEAMNVFVDNGGSNPEYLQLAALDRADRGANPSGEWYTIQMHSSKGITQISVFSVNRAGDCHIQAQAIETP